MGVIYWIAGLAGAGVIVFGLTCGAVIVQHKRMVAADDAEQPEGPPVKVAIVLGSGVRPDGTINNQSRKRTERAIAFLRERGAERLIFSGGPMQHCPSRPTADVMRDYAVAAGVRAERILLENRSRTTFENLRHSVLIADELGAASDGSDIAIVTDSSHMLRSWLLMSYFGRPRAQLVVSNSLGMYDTHDKIIVITREAAAWWFNVGKVLAWEGLGLFGVPPELRARFVR